MNRRAFVAGLAAALAAPLAAEAQQTGRAHRVGFLGLSSPADYGANLQAFRQGLKDLGYEEGRNISIEYRWAEGRNERLPGLAAELVALKPDVLVTHGGPGIHAAQQATSTIPIVMGVSSDPVRLGFVKSLARPGGNTTGVTAQLFELAAKRLEVLRDAVPGVRQVAVLSTTVWATSLDAVRDTEAGARKLDLRMRSFRAEPTNLDATFVAIQRERADGLLVIPDSMFAGARGARIAAFAVSNRLPSIGGDKGFVLDGGLMSYGGDFSKGWRVAARYVDKILKGAKPADLPIQQPMKFELIINLKTAKALGLTIPPSVLARADQVIE